MNEHPVARSTDPQTSWEAANSVTRFSITKTRAAILRVLTNEGPLTDEQIAEQLADLSHTSPSGLRTRRKELVNAGMVRDSGQRKKMSSGRSAIVWELHKS